MRISGDLLVELDVLVELAEQGPPHGLDFMRATIGSAECRGLGRHVFAGVLDPNYLRAFGAFDEHLHGAVRQLQHLQDGRDAADLVQIVGTRIVLGGGFWATSRMCLPASIATSSALIDFGAHEQRDHHVRENDDVAQREQRKRCQFSGLLREFGSHRRQYILRMDGSTLRWG